MNIDMKILDSRLGTEFPIPTYAKEGDAGIDLRAMIDSPIHLYPGDEVVINSGIAVNMKDSGIMGLVTPRSGLGTKGLVISNTVGIIDSGYIGEIKLSMLNRKIRGVDSDNFPILINPGDRIAQLIFLPIVRAEFNIVDDLGTTERGEGGFNSSGIK